MTRVKGHVVLTDPTEEVLAILLFWMVPAPGGFDLRRIAREVLGRLGWAASYEIAPGLVASTGDGRMARKVKLRWDCRLTADGTENPGPYTPSGAGRPDRTRPSAN